MKRLLGMKAALVTLGIDLSEMESLSHSFFRAYAARYQIDFRVIDQFRYRVRPNLIRKRWVQYHVEKFQIQDLFDTYDRILYLDSDILIHPSCPNLFELVPDERLGIVYDDQNEEAWKRLEELEKIEKRLGALPTSQKRYFNAGVMVLGKAHRPLFEFKREEIYRGRWPEQTLLNYRSIRDAIPIKELSIEYNFNPGVSKDWNRLEERMKAQLIHYAGPSAKKVMASDYKLLKTLWENHV